MKILITGAAGGIGSLICESLGEHFELVLVDNFRNGFRENLPNHCIHEIDICSKEFIDLTKNVKPDVILHLAAITSLPDCESNKSECIQVNVNGTVNVLEAARHANVEKIIFASTSAVYENNLSTESPFIESLQVSPLLFYSLSKKMAEDVCNSYIKNYDMNIITLRFFNIFGPNQDTKRKSPPLLNYLVKSVIDQVQPVLHSDGKQERDYVSAYDLVELIKTILQNDTFESDCYNVASGATLSVKDIVHFVEVSLGTKVNPIFRSPSMLWDNYPALFETNKPLNKNVISKEANKFSLGCNKKLFKKFGWKPTTEFQKEFEKVIIKLSERIKNED
jgi:nucleoside-diphosphate-sugar epimerase